MEKILGFSGRITRSSSRLDIFMSNRDQRDRFIRLKTVALHCFRDIGREIVIIEPRMAIGLRVKRTKLRGYAAPGPKGSFRERGKRKLRHCSHFETVALIVFLVEEISENERLRIDLRQKESIF